MKRVLCAAGAAILLYLAAACAGGTDPSHLCDDKGASAVVTGTGAQTFSPVAVSVQAGQSVCWYNDGQVAHTVTSDDDATFNSALGNRSSYTHTFPDAGSFTYHCEVHPGMVGSVTVQ